jgi:hypothetical protein
MSVVPARQELETEGSWSKANLGKIRRLYLRNKRKRMEGIVKNRKGLGMWWP